MSIDLYWIPLGAGGHCVRFNGRVFEAICAARERRARRDLYHAALVVGFGGERYAIEVTPSPDSDEASRGVVAMGIVGSRRLGRLRMFRYEVRCWRAGHIPDLAYAVGGPRRLTEDPRYARRVLEAVASVPTPVWGRDELDAGEMWNSNSMVAWLLATAGLPAQTFRPPAQGRAPGWGSGLVVARAQAATRSGSPAHARRERFDRVPVGVVVVVADVRRVAAALHQYTHQDPRGEVVLAVLQRAREGGSQLRRPPGALLEVVEVVARRRARVVGVVGRGQADREERRRRHVEAGAVPARPPDDLLLMVPGVDRRAGDDDVIAARRRVGRGNVVKHVDEVAAAAEDVSDAGGDLVRVAVRAGEGDQDLGHALTVGQRRLRDIRGNPARGYGSLRMRVARPSATLHPERR